MIKEFTADFEYLYKTRNQKQIIGGHKDMINIIKHYINPDSKILDIGERNPLTGRIEEYHKCKIENTEGDIDVNFSIPSDNYNIIIFSHIIEHIFNPLHALLRIKKVMNNNTVLIVALPQRTKLLWTKGHYHEIDDYRIRLLFKRANLKVIRVYKDKIKREFWFYFTGFRPMLRLLLEYNVVYILKLNEKDTD